MYVILDLETTGLDWRTADVLELGMVVADDNFVPVDDFDVVIEWNGDISALDPVVQEMHAKTGLWDKCLAGVPLPYAEAMALQFLEECYDAGILQGPGTFEMVGNTISFDRGILLSKMPRLFSQFHYRNIDVSTLKVLARKYGHPDYVPDDDAEHNLHMALSDCYDSLHELEHYTKLFGIAK